MTKGLLLTLIYLSTFSIAFGFMESIVVVYLRQLYYPEGFSFPLKLIALKGLSIEYIREVITIVILLSVSMIAGKNFYERFSYFLFCFGLWDIFYYISLKVLLDWPSSLFTWDILFLIPIIWSGPVIAPLIYAVTMVAIAVSILYLKNKEHSFKIATFEWILLLAGAFIVFLSFIWEYGKIILKRDFISVIFQPSINHEINTIISCHVPSSFNWPLFIFGECLTICFLVIFSIRTQRVRRKNELSPKD